VQRLVVDSAIVEVLLLKVKVSSQSKKADETTSLMKTYCMKILAVLLQTSPEQFSSRMLSMNIEQILIAQLRENEDALSMPGGTSEAITLIIESLHCLYWLVNQNGDAVTGTLVSMGLGKHLSTIKHHCDSERSEPEHHDEMVSQMRRDLLRHVAYVTYAIKERQETRQMLDGLISPTKAKGSQHGTSSSAGRGLLNGLNVSYLSNDSPSKFLDPNFEYSPSKMLGIGSAVESTLRGDVVKQQTPVKEVSPVKLQFETPREDTEAVQERGNNDTADNVSLESDGDNVEGSDQQESVGSLKDDCEEGNQR